MEELSDQDLLRRFVTHRSEEAMAAIVQRYLPLVFASARRLLSDPASAEDVAQAVFIILAKKAPHLRAPLAAWLLTTTRYCAADLTKRNRRRAFHERKAATMRHESQPPITLVAESHEHLAAFLDDALARLSESDRNAVALHYLQSQPIPAVAAALGHSPLATRKRIERAIHKLHLLLLRSTGASVTIPQVHSLLTPLPTAAIPSTLASTVTHVALHTSAHVAAASIPALISKGAIHMMTLAKLKIAASFIMAFFLITGLTSYGVHALAAAQTPAPVTARPLPSAAPSPAPLADANPDTDTGVEIIAVGPYSTGDHEWWTPTGEKSAFTRPATHMNQQPEPGVTLFEIAVRIKPGTSRDYSFANTRSSVGGPNGMRYLCLAVPQEQTTGSLRLTYSVEPWRTVVRVPLQHGGIASTGFLQGNFAAFSGLLQTGNDVTIVLADDASLNADRRYIAIDTAGRQIPAAPGGSVGNGKFNMTVITFKDLKQEDVQFFRCDIRPLTSWLIFSGISLNSLPSQVQVSTGSAPLPPALENLPLAPEDPPVK
jgi:RNA polymerase sigma factor (sigma-70 family)